jgi:hypothetical protein
MEMKADSGKLLMSEALRGRLPEDIENEAAVSLESQALTAVVHLRVGDTKTALVGILRSVLAEAEPELELRAELERALDVVQAKDLQVLGFELHHGERVIPFEGPFNVKGARIDDVDTFSQLCTLSVGLKRPAGVLAG